MASGTHPGRGSSPRSFDSFVPSQPTESLNTRPTPLSLIDLRKATPIQFSALLPVEGAGRIGKRLATAVKLELLGAPSAQK